MTVSRVINGSGHVSEELRKRVQEAVDRLEYHPNALARSLKSQRTHVVGILLSDIQNPFSAELAGSIQEVLLEAGYSAFLCTTDRSIERERAALNAFIDHRVAGIIVATLATQDGDEALKRLVRRGLPAVMVGRQCLSPKLDRVSADHWKGAHEAVEHLISLGHTRIGYVGASVQHAARLKRFQGFLDALRDHGLAAAPELIVGPENDSGPGYSTQSDGYAGMQELLQLRQPPSAVFARNDFTAMGAMAAARDRGLAIPRDIAIVGFDNVPISAYTVPPLTTVEQPTAQQGREAAAMLLERISGNSVGKPREAHFACRLIVRASTVGVESAAGRQS